MPEKCKIDSQNYDFNKDVLPVLQMALDSPEKLENAHNSFVKATSELGERVKTVGGIDSSVDIVLYLGLCCGAGWATTLEGRHVVLIGIEKIVELGWYDLDKMSALIYHELGHIWHYVIGGISDKDLTTPIMQMYSEGIAMHFQQLIIGDPECYHQDKDGWLEWCYANKTDLNIEFLRRLEAGENVQDFFWRLV